MTPSQLRYLVESTGSNHFTRDSMRFFGDTMRNYGVRRCTVVTRDGERLTVWQLYRRRPVKHGNRSPAYFDMGGRRVFNVETVED